MKRVIDSDTNKYGFSEFKKFGYNDKIGRIVLNTFIDKIKYKIAIILIKIKLSKFGNNILDSLKEKLIQEKVEVK